jgi:hypothetical protein
LERNLEKFVVTVQALLAATEAGLPSESAGGEAETAAPDEARAPDMSPERDGEDPKLQESQRQEQLEIDARAREADARQRTEAVARSRREAEQARAGAPPKRHVDAPNIKSQPTPAQPASARQSTAFTAPRAGNMAAKIPGRAALNAVGAALGAQGVVQMALCLCVLFAKDTDGYAFFFRIDDETKWVLVVMAFVSTATIVAGLLVLTRALRPFRAIGLAVCATNIVCSVLWVSPLNGIRPLGPYLFAEAMDAINTGVGFVFLSTLGFTTWFGTAMFFNIFTIAVFGGSAIASSVCLWLLWIHKALPEARTKPVVSAV